jgi:hypothetical protein
MWESWRGSTLLARKKWRRERAQFAIYRQDQRLTVVAARAETTSAAQSFINEFQLDATHRSCSGKGAPEKLRTTPPADPNIDP